MDVKKMQRPCKRCGSPELWHVMRDKGQGLYCWFCAGKLKEAEDRIERHVHAHIPRRCDDGIKR